MATGIITNTITDPSGTAVASATIIARLKPDSAGFRSNASEIAREVATTTDVSGNWSLTLEINADITPGDTYWEIEEKIPDANGGPRVWAVSVASGSHTLYASLVSSPPATSVPAYITQSQADARYIPVTGGVGLGLVSAVGTVTITGTATSAAASNHAHPLGTAIVTNSHVATPFILAQVNTATSTQGVAQGSFIYNSNSTSVRLATGQTSLVDLSPVAATNIAAGQTTTQTAYLALPSSPPTVRLFTNTKVLVTVSGYLQNSTANQVTAVSVAVSGATTVAASDTNAATLQAYANNAVGQISNTSPITGLTPGFNVFTMNYRVDGGTGTVARLHLIVQPLPV